MASFVMHNPAERHGLFARSIFFLLIMAVHLVLAYVTLESRAKPWRTAPPSTPTIATWNILASNEAPPARAAPDPKASPIQVNLDAPTIEIEEPAPLASGLGATMPIDPYAGAAPVKAGTVQVVNVPISVPKRAVPKLDDSDDPYTLWLAKLRETLQAMPSARSGPVKPVRIEVLAQPAGGFTTARIVQGSGDAAIDRKILVDLMQHKELVERGRVTASKWLALPAIDLTPG